MIKTLSILIGNTDDKLTQKQWSEFVQQVDRIVKVSAKVIHFMGSTIATSQYQSYCVVIEIIEDRISSFKESLKNIKKQYNQDSIAFVEGITSFI